MIPALQQEQQRLIERLGEIESHILAITGVPRAIVIRGKIFGITRDVVAASFSTHEAMRHEPLANGEPYMPPPRFCTNADPIEELVGRFADALRIKLKAAREKYGYTGTPEPWQETGWEDQLREQLREHVAKGDPLDVAAYAAFAWHHGWSTARQPAAPSYDPDRADAAGDDAGDDVSVAPAPSWTPDQVAQFNALTPEQSRTLGRAAADITEIGREAGTPVEATAPEPVHTNLPTADETRRRHGRQVIDLDSGERWASAPDAATVFGVNVVNIYKVCNGKQNSTAGRRLAWADAAPVPVAAPTETAPAVEPPAPAQRRKPKTKAVIDRDTGERWDSAAIAAAALGLKNAVAVYNNIAGNSNTVAGRRLAWADSMPAATEPSSAPTPKRDFTARPIVDPNAPPAPINPALLPAKEVESQAEFDARIRREREEARRKAETFPAEGGA